MDLDTIPESPHSGTSDADCAADSVAESKDSEPDWANWSEVQHRVRVFADEHARWWEFAFGVTPLTPGGGGGGAGDAPKAAAKVTAKAERMNVMVWTNTDLVAPAERLGVNYINEVYDEPVSVCNPSPHLKSLRAILCPRELAVGRGPDIGATRLDANMIVTCAIPVRVTGARGRVTKKTFRVGVVSKLPMQTALNLARAYAAAETGGEVLRDGTRCTENHFRAILADTAMLRAEAPPANDVGP